MRDVCVTLLRPSLFMQDMTRRHFAPHIIASNVFYQLGKLSTVAVEVEVKLGTNENSNNNNINNNNTTITTTTYAGTYIDGYTIAMVDARDIGDVAACVLSEPPTNHNNTYILCGPKSYSWTDIAIAISTATGRNITPILLSDVALLLLILLLCSIL